MVSSCVEPLALYRPRDPQASGLWRLMDQHFETFRRVYDQQFAAKYGFWRPVTAIRNGDRDDNPATEKARVDG